MELVLSHKGRSGSVEVGVGGRCEHVCIRLQSIRLYVCVSVCIYVCMCVEFLCIGLYSCGSKP